MLPFGIGGIFKALPFAIWFYLAIEELPLAAEESMDPRRDVPKGTIWGMHTLLIFGVLTLFINTGVDGGAASIGVSGVAALRRLQGRLRRRASPPRSWRSSGVIGLVASFFTIIYAYGRNTYSLSRAGYFPKWLSVTHGERKTPHVALIAGAIVGYARHPRRVVSAAEGSGAQVVAAVLNMAVFAAVISYALQCSPSSCLRQNLPNIDRPYLSKWGVPGAVIAGAIAVISLVAMFLNEAYRPGVYGVAVYYVLGVLYFAIAGRHRLVLSPEEEFALTQGAQSFETSSAEQEAILRGGEGASDMAATYAPPPPPPAE